MSSADRTVVVAEDEPLVRMMAAGMLTEAGFDVIETTHAGEALAAVEQQDGKVLALFTDVHMPGGCDGLELARRVHAQWPGIAVLVASCFSRPSRDELPPGGQFVAKPYRGELIVERMKAFGKTLR